MPESVSTSHVPRATSEDAVHTYNGTELYGYDPSGRRVWKQEPSRTLVYFHGEEGNLLATYGDGIDYDYNVYFGGKLIWAEASQGLAAGPVSLDRMGSVVLRNNGATNEYFPCGEEATTTTADRTKFATYYRDQVTALDYAQNRYYSSTIARFTSPDPSEPFAPTNPQSFNLYAYVQNDPVNLNDPEGLDITIPVTYGPYDCTSRVYGEILSRSGYGGENALTDFARGDWGRMALAMWGEIRPDSASDGGMNVAMMGVGYTFINRYNLRGTIPDFGASSSSLGTVVMIASDIWETNGDMQGTAYTALTNALAGSATSGDCDGLIEGIKLGAAIMAQTVGFKHGGFGALPNVYNPVGNAVYFNSKGYQLGTHPYGYVGVRGPILPWTGWQGSQRVTKYMYFWGISRVAPPAPSPGGAQRGAPPVMVHPQRPVFAP